MKRTTSVVILAGLVCALMICAGCTSTPATNNTTTTTHVATTTGTAPATVAATSTAAASAQVWNGTWNTTWTEDGETASSISHFVQAGSNVTGLNTADNGTFNGTVSGNRLAGNWTGVNGTESSEGPFEFVLSTDNASFTGKWAYNPEDLANSTYSWDGVRV